MLVLLCAAIAPALAGDLRNYTHDVWTTRDGLPHNTISDMAQSREGYLWLATWEGLVRYNGTEFRLYDRSSQPALRDAAIAALHASRDGGLWFADSRGNLGHWQLGDRLRYWGKAEGLPGTVIDGVFEDAQGQVWLTFNGTGLGRLQPASGRFDMLRPAAHGTGFVGLRPVQDDDGRLWIGTLRGLMYVEGNELLPAPEAFGLPARLAWPYRAPDGRIWVVAGNALHFMQGGQLRLWRSLPQAGRITALLQDGYGAIWVGTENRGVLRVDEDGVEHLGRDMGLPEGRLGVLFEDHERSLWAGTNGGLYRLREALFRSMGVQSGLGSDFVRTLAEDERGWIWSGGAAGLDGLAPDGGIHHVELRPGHANRGDVSLLSLLPLDGDLWAGTYGDGLYQLRDGKALAHYDHDNGLPNNHVRSLAPARGGGLWVGTRQGVTLLRDGEATPLQAEGLPRTLVHALLETDSALWIAAMSGLYRYADGVATRIPLGDGDDAGLRVLALYHDAARDSLWASSDRGLYRVRGDEVAHVGLEQGLPVDAVFQMVVDGRGSAWLGSNRGVLRMDHAALNAVADGRAERVGVDLYGIRDGMANAQGNGSAGTSTLLARDGAVWFATAGGAAVVLPERMQQFGELPPPAVVVEGLLADGRPLSFTEQGNVVQVPAGTRRLTIAYAALTYLSPQGVRYRTRLEGFDRDWVPRGSHRSVEFTSLSPGDYTLQVAAANGEGAAPGDPAVLHLRIAPYWWQRGMVQAAAALALVLLAWGLYRRRMVRYHRHAERLERLVDERTEDLRRQAERLAEADHEKQGLLDRLGEQARLLERQAYQDALTGLPNRRALEERARAEIERMRHGAPLSLALLDIDHFKRFNDERSHAIGDAVLRRFAQVVGGACRPGDFVARFGGEEFVLLLPGLSHEAARQLCERMRVLVQDSNLSQVAQGLPVTVSIGVVEGGGGSDFEEMMQVADEALYRAKNGGRNRVECAGRLH